MVTIKQFEYRQRLKQKLKDNPLHKGYKHSEETRKKLKKARNRRSIPKEVGINISKSLKGVPKSKEHIINMANAHRGLKRTIKQKQRMSDAHIGKNTGKQNNMWKGGISSLIEKIRKSVPYKIWRRKIYQRDNYECRLCKSKIDLNAHHNKEFSKYPELRFDINNGITLCKKCHTTLHKTLNYARVNKLEGEIKWN